MRRIQEGWGGPVAIEWFAPTMADDAEFCDWWARLLRSGTSPGGVQRLFELYRRLDTRAVLPNIRVPTLVLHRRADRLVSVAQASYFAERIPGARYVELEGADHVFLAGDQDALMDEAEEFLTGARPVREPDRILVTVMFTDIVGSTARAGALGDAGWRDLLERHDSVVEAEVARHRGRLVKSLGDGFLATFDGPARAVSCAKAIGAGVRPLGIEVRAGLHTGEVEAMGDDVGGIAVHIGARIGAQAQAGEVLVSSTVKDLVVGSGLGFSERGTHALKGVPGEWRLFAAA